jgi:hypothetical protein
MSYLNISILLFTLTTFLSPAIAMEIKVSYVSGFSNFEYGTSDVDGVLNVTRRGYAIDAETSGEAWYTAFHLENYTLKANELDTLEQELNWSIFLGRRFGTETNHIALSVGAGASDIMFMEKGTTSDTLNKSSAPASSINLKINSDFLSYELFFDYYQGFSIGSYDMQGRKIAHKTSLNLGSTIKYGIYHLRQDFDLSGDYLNTRTDSLTGFYLGYSF